MCNEIHIIRLIVAPRLTFPKLPAPRGCSRRRSASPIHVLLAELDLIKDKIKVEQSNCVISRCASAIQSTDLPSGQSSPLEGAFEQFASNLHPDCQSVTKETAEPRQGQWWQIFN